MSLISNNNQGNKKGKKTTNSNAQASKFAVKPKAASFSKKPVKTGGTRGS